MSNDTRRINVDIDKKLWHEVGIESAKLGITKKDFTTMALREKINKINKESKNEDNHP